MNQSPAALLQDLVYGFHVLAQDGQDSGVSGHLTARAPGAQTFWTLPFGFGFEEAAGNALIETDFDLNTVTGSGACNPTLHIHTEIYRARPDVNCIVHTHAANAIALGITGSNLEPVTQSGALFYEDVALFDEFEGIVLERGGGSSIAAALGGRRALLLRHHGSLVVGRSVREAVIAATMLEFVAGIQLKAMSAGPLRRLPRAEALQSKGFLLSAKVMDLRWDHLVRQVRRARPGLAIDPVFVERPPDSALKRAGA